MNSLHLRFKQQDSVKM